MSALEKCVVISCLNSISGKQQANRSNLIFFAFPKDSNLSQVWREKCGVSSDYNTETAIICSDHFTSTDYVDNTKTVLLSDAIPNQNLTWLSTAPDFNAIKNAVDLNMELTKQISQLQEETNDLQIKLRNSEKKNRNILLEINRFKNLKTKGKKYSTKLEQNLISKVFSSAQIKKLMGKKKVVWSYDDMAMAFTLRHMGNRESYLYLKDTLNIPLPSLLAVQKWVASNQHSCIK